MAQYVPTFNALAKGLNDVVNCNPSTRFAVDGDIDESQLHAEGERTPGSPGTPSEDGSFAVEDRTVFGDEDDATSPDDENLEAAWAAFIRMRPTASLSNSADRTAWRFHLVCFRHEQRDAVSDEQYLDMTETSPDGGRSEYVACRNGHYTLDADGEPLRTSQGAQGIVDCDCRICTLQAEFAAHVAAFTASDPQDTPEAHQMQWDENDEMD